MSLGSAARFSVWRLLYASVWFARHVAENLRREGIDRFVSIVKRISDGNDISVVSMMVVQL